MLQNRCPVLSYMIHYLFFPYFLLLFCTVHNDLPIYVKVSLYFRIKTGYMRTITTPEERLSGYPTRFSKPYRQTNGFNKCICSSDTKISTTDISRLETWMLVMRWEEDLKLPKVNIWRSCPSDVPIHCHRRSWCKVEGL